ncbi:MAG: decarboxylating 6-phosphogluconate dehydrogenase [Candidatus Sungbacteria bacterium]|nr:decarboxylating 6-phosphogluconate dehydrogenase [Candidatus Sungbacteria bacterium]
MRREVGLVGLGKMGKGMANRLIRQGWRVVAFNRSPEAFHDAPGAERARSLEELVEKLHAPRVVWLMLPHGEPTEQAIFGSDALASLLRADDVLIDGANAFYKDSMRRAQLLAEKGIRFLDVGVSGGPRGAREGASLMIGGDKYAYEALTDIFSALAVQSGFRYFGQAGAGHFVKMIHNGIEYGMMQAIAEGFNILRQSPFLFSLNDVADLYNHGTVIESRLIGWTRAAFRQYGESLEGVSGTVAHTGEGQWTVETAKEFGEEAPIIGGSLQFRIRSGERPSFTGKILSALRNQFGGHSVSKVSSI